MSIRSLQIGHVPSPVMNEAFTSSQVCSCKSAGAARRQPGQEGCGAPSAVKVKFFVWSGVLDSKLIT
jgi:hypothetical protein